MNWITLLLLAQTLGAGITPLAIGDKIAKVEFKDTRYLRRDMADFGPRAAYVFIFSNTTCPLVQKYWPKLRRLEKEYRSRNVQFAAINASAGEGILDIATQAVEWNLEFPVLKDFDGLIAKQWGVTHTPQVVILDREYHLRYRGRVDDQYRAGGARATPTREDLTLALDAVLAGKDVAKSTTPIDGCPITFAHKPAPAAVDFATHVAPVLRQHCLACHHVGGETPFSLTTYTDAARHAQAIAEVVTDGRMPPWFASSRHGTFSNQPHFTEKERRILRDWATLGMPGGEDARTNVLAPANNQAPPTERKVTWSIDTPDLVVNMLETHELPAEGYIPYKYVMLPYLFLEDTWIQAAEILPDNPRVVHHCNLGYVPLGGSRTTPRLITGKVPGGTPLTLEDGIALRIPRGAVLGMQVHYSSTGKTEKCRIAVGFRFPRVPVNKELRHLQIAAHGFAIPPGAPAHPVRAARVLDRDAMGVGMFAHMHLRGKDITFTAHYPDRSQEILLMVPNYHFDWQLAYRFPHRGKHFPKGTRVECLAHFDNSPFNPYNPDANVTVGEGQQTYQEMMYGYFFYLDAHEKLQMRVDPRTGRAVR